MSVRTKRPLGCNLPPDKEHVKTYPLSSLIPEYRPTHIPVVVGFPWYAAFDTPILGTDGVYRLPADNLGQLEGYHCFCLEPEKQPNQPGEEQDRQAWWTFYNQFQEPACEGFGHGRAMSLLFRRTFDALWLYDDARRAEGTYPDGEGATNRATCEALVKWGAHYEEGEVCERTPWRMGVPGRSIAKFRWVTTADEIRSTLGYPATVGEFPFLNSWGREDYPEVVRIPDTLCDLFISSQEGEADVFTEH
jgi:hypothetical protein